MFYLEVFDSLNREKVKYLVVGGLAVNLHGVPRVTYDIDIIISTDRDNVLNLNRALKRLGYVPRLPIDPDDLAEEGRVKDWMENRNMRAFSFHHRTENRKVVDIVIDHPLDFAEAFRRRATMKAGGIDIPVASIVDMVAMKKASDRAKDRSDMEMLEEARRLTEPKDG